MSYTGAVKALSFYMDTGTTQGTVSKMTAFDASFALAIMFPEKTKEQAMDDLISYRLGHGIPE